MYYFNLIIIACAILCACDAEKQAKAPIVLSGPTMGTSYTIKINHSQQKIDSKSIKINVDKLLEQINQQMSTYLNDSELSKINQSHTQQWINISDDLFTVLNTALSISELTKGAFDITIGPIVNLWGFGPQIKPDQIPSDKAIASTLKNTSYQLLHLRESPRALKKDNISIYIDLSGIAKGYAIDRVATYLNNVDIKNYMIEIGGEIAAKGINHKNLPWKIGIEKPIAGQRTVLRVIELDNIAMATSGDYRNYFDKNGIRYSHTINPKTGRPIEHQLVSVTVLHHSAMYADALATALLVMGSKAGMQLAKQENWAVLFITKENNDFIEVETEAFSNPRRRISYNIP